MFGNEVFDAIQGVFVGEPFVILVEDICNNHNKKESN